MKVMSFFRQRVLRSFVLMAITFQLTNISVDPVDSLVGAEDVALNEIESCVELVLEVFMGKRDAIKETDEADNSPQKHRFGTMILFCAGQHTISHTDFSDNTREGFMDYTSAFDSPLLAILSPPPKVG